MKEIKQTEESIEEFEKEVSMLDKFRNEYIVHFYGAVFIPNKICMVTEYAKYGSLNDLIHKYKEYWCWTSLKNLKKIKCCSINSEMNILFIFMDKYLFQIKYGW